MKLNAESVEIIMDKEGLKTQAQLADRLGVNRATISRAMSGGKVGGKLLEAFRKTFPEYSLEYLMKD